MKYNIKYSKCIKYGGMSNDHINIFCFWEPYDKIPSYLKLCMNTWNKISNSTVILLNYSNLFEYIDKETFHNNFYKLNLPKQADCIRVAILEKYGGLWLDLDTIIVNDLRDILSDKLTFFGDDNNEIHMAFIYSKNPNNNILREWLDIIKKKLINFELDNKWDYIGNSIIDKLIKKYPDDTNILNRHEFKIFPEGYLNNEYTYEGYINFWFKNNLNSILQDNYIIMLHNSWTPNEFKNMNEELFLESDILLSKFLKTLQ